MLGFGHNAKRLLLLAAFVGLLAGLGFLPLLETQFSAKTSAKVACNDMVRYREFDEPNNFNANRPAYGEEKWRKTFLASIRGLGVQLTEEQYSFEIGQENGTGDYECHVKVFFNKKGKWPYVSDFISDLPPLIHKVRLDFTHVIRKRY